MTDFYKDVPKDLEQNLEYRIDLRKRCIKSQRLQRAVKAACAHDVLFFFNAFCVLYEPRPKIVDGIKQPNIFPFITWPHQDVAIRQIKEVLGYEDVGVEKSRGEGMSWIGILLALHSWLFEPNSKVGLVSRTESMADDPEDSDSLFWKIDWEITKLPVWMTGRKGKDWKRIISTHTLTNHRNGARITADAATGDVFRGGRLSWALMDEFAFFRNNDDSEALNSSHGATNSRLFVSTVNGQSNEYYRIMHEPSSMRKVIIDWKQNVSRNRGLYVLRAGKAFAVDPINNPLLTDYENPTKDVLDRWNRLRDRGFKLDNGKQRSPWYDHECDRPGMTPQRIAQELDRNYAGSQALIFGEDFHKKVDATIQQPTAEGMANVIEDTSDGEVKYKINWQANDDGLVKLWVPLDYAGNPPKSEYVFGADVSSGLGGSYTSNSTLIGIDLQTGDQILEIATNIIPPGEFAELAVAICNWFHGAYLGWEHNGPGSAFTKRMIGIGYGNVYRRKSQSKRSKRKTKELGWWTDDKTKESLFMEILRSISKRDVRMRSTWLKTECNQYIRLNGRIQHSSSLTTDDESSKNAAHGDRVIAFGVALQCMLDRPTHRDFETQKKNGSVNASDPPPNTLAARQKEYEDSLKAKDQDTWIGSIWDRLARR